MIYTITLNPSLDYIIQVDCFNTGKINKTTYEKILPGGKGINVSLVLSNLGYSTKALGFIAGFTGKEIKKKVNELGCDCDFIKVKDGLSRINIKMMSEEETEINGQGPTITPSDLDKLYHKLDMLTTDDILVISGSIPSTLPNNIYDEIIQRIQHKNIKIIVDTTKDLLESVLKYKPFLIKPNHLELSELFNTPIHTKNEIIHYGCKLQKMGAQNVLISMADKGAVLIDIEQNIYDCPAPKGIVVNSVGAGDSMVAGFLAGYLETKNYKEALKKGICAGSASAFSHNLATAEEINTLLTNLK